MWDFWASDPLKKTFRRKPFILNGESPFQKSLDDYVRFKDEAERSFQPGQFVTGVFMGEGGLLADALARQHRRYGILDTRTNSGSVIVAYA